MKTTAQKKRSLTASLIALVLVCAALIFLDMNKSSYGMAVSILQKAAIYSVVAVSMNLLNGFTGLFSLGQAGFMAIGAYTAAILTIPVESRAGVYYISGINPAIANIYLPFPLALVVGGLVAALFAALIGIPVLRLKSDYLAIATLGFSEIIRALIAAPQMDTITNGSYGLKLIPVFSHLIIPFAIAAVCILVMVLMINSSYGRAFKAIREDEVAAEAMGINLFRTKLMSFITSSFFAGVGGGMLAMYMSSIDSGTFKVTITYDILLIVVLGGMGSVTGSILGSFLVVASKDWWLRFFDDPLTIAGVSIPLFRTGFRMVVFSVLLMVIVLFYRRGIMGTTEFSWGGLAGFFKKLPGRIKGWFAARGAKKGGGTNG
ncbi:MAG: branched-chain amino acid ABC transporter permease [Oscillospiraceae bacterium]